ncbi:MAG: hypothetical protein KF712_16080 [Akkermansiaceae bacterium]|nr:hypothetical protein [Akkermansiaceae bacterium]
MIRSEPLLSQFVIFHIRSYALLFEPFLPGFLLHEIDPTARNRHFGHIPVF